jgi:hypothetical protein
MNWRDVLFKVAACLFPAYCDLSNASSLRLSVGYRSTVLIAVLAALASGVGLWVPSVYRDTAWVIPQSRGQDLVTLLSLPALLWALYRAREGSPRATLIWLGLLGYLAYTYTAAALVYAFNWLFPVYVALFSLCGTALIAGLSGIDATAISGAFDAKAPRRSVVAFLSVMAIALSVLWGAQIVPFYVNGSLPAMIVLANTPTVYVFALDLGIVVPLSILSAWWLWNQHAWGYVLAGFILVKAATMGLALLSMTWFAIRAGLSVQVTLSLVWVVLAIAGLAMSAVYFSSCRNARDITARFRSGV